MLNLNNWIALYLKVEEVVSHVDDQMKFNKERQNKNIKILNCLTAFLIIFINSFGITSVLITLFSKNKE